MRHTRNHTTHYACKEIINRDGGKAVGCCCTGHKCNTAPAERYVKRGPVEPTITGIDPAKPGADFTVFNRPKDRTK